MPTKQEIEKQLEVLRQEIKQVKGTKCEVWSRVVGYLRPVQSYNVGKQEEYHLRKKHDIVK